MDVNCRSKTVEISGSCYEIGYNGVGSFVEDDSERFRSVSTRISPDPAVTENSALSHKIEHGSKTPRQ
ncbi:hypothetical protein GWI33_017992 [Rhynchophorus ferrugineus]|uniref:Uncharacterized protein n=1 Tax=Rhynchophorus ferrugineus TaxID=354439 RepID=A0A834I855_RHYFE|nr:hypothetical protein GWI33_017992 [Rhynchophorus ferrugineus]